MHQLVTINVNVYCSISQVCPAALVSQWLHELAKHHCNVRFSDFTSCALNDADASHRDTPYLTVAVYHGIEACTKKNASPRAYDLLRASFLAK